MHSACAWLCNYWRGGFKDRTSFGALHLKIRPDPGTGHCLALHVHSQMRGTSRVGDFFGHYAQTNHSFDVCANACVVSVAHPTMWRY